MVVQAMRELGVSERPGNPVVVPPIMEALVSLGPPAVPTLLAALDDPDQQTRVVAAYALGRIGDRRAFEPLMASIRGEGRPIWNAYDALGHLGDTRAVEPLIEVLNTDTTGAWFWAALALARIGDERARAPLLAKLEAGRVEARQGSTADSFVGVARALLVLDKQFTTDLLVEAAADETPAIRVLALEAIYGVDDPRVPGLLNAALSDSDAKVREEASRAIYLRKKYRSN